MKMKPAQAHSHIKDQANSAPENTYACLFFSLSPCHYLLAFPTFPCIARRFHNYFFLSPLWSSSIVKNACRVWVCVKIKNLSEHKKFLILVVYTYCHHHHHLDSCGYILCLLITQKVSPRVSLKVGKRG